MIEMKTIVKFIDKTTNGLHVVNAVTINDQYVTIEEGTVDITYGTNEPTRLSLTLLVDEIHFEHGE